MECNKVKSLLSEYLDRTLHNDLNRNVKEHLLSCKTCSKEFFLIKSISDELAGLEKIKAPNYLLNRINQSVTSPSLFRKIFDFIPGSGGFKFPMEFVTLTTTVVLVFLIFTNIHDNKNENVTITGSGGRTTITDKSKGPVQLGFIPAGRRTLSSEKTRSVTSDPSSYNYDNLIPRLNKLILLEGGDMVSKEYQLDTGRVDAVTVKIPLNSYNSFIRKAETLGRFTPPAPPLSHQSPDPVLLRIKLNF